MDTRDLDEQTKLDELLEGTGVADDGDRKLRGTRERCELLLQVRVASRVHVKSRQEGR